MIRVVWLWYQELKLDRMTPHRICHSFLFPLTKLSLPRERCGTFSVCPLKISTVAVYMSSKQANNRPVLLLLALQLLLLPRPLPRHLPLYISH
jgi:hypothetical protein